MTMRRMVIYILLMALGVPAWAGQPQEEADRILASVQGVDALPSLMYTARRTSTGEGQRIADEWTFRYVHPDRIRVDYADPLRRIVVINQGTMTEYIPEAKKAMVTALNKLSESERVVRVSQALSRVAVMGLRAGDFSGMIPQVTSVTRDKEGTVTIMGAPPRFEIVVDPKRQVILSSTIFDEDGKLMLQTRSTEFVQVEGNVWFPRRVKTMHRAAGTMVDSRIAFSGIQRKVPRVDEVFHLSLPENTEILRGN
ncbi:MAG: hypothetical protein ISS35_00325 [Kiritimatiellae bacterium]|nr:hypothetical protein [Kiritimatiellia bacterium]